MRKAITLGGYILCTKSVRYEKGLLSPMLGSLKENKDVFCCVFEWLKLNWYADLSATGQQSTGASCAGVDGV